MIVETEICKKALRTIVKKADKSNFELGFTMDGYADNPVDQWRYKMAAEMAQVAKDALRQTE